MADMPPELGSDGSSEAVRKVRVHKVRSSSKQSPLAGMSQSSAAALGAQLCLFEVMALALWR